MHHWKHITKTQYGGKLLPVQNYYNFPTTMNKFFMWVFLGDPHLNVSPLTVPQYGYARSIAIPSQYNKDIKRSLPTFFCECHIAAQKRCVLELL